MAPEDDSRRRESARSSPAGGVLFARCGEDSRLVSVRDVPRGLRSGCVCPDCGLPLIARQGKVNVWHFAHAGDPAGVARAPCGFGLASSLRAKAVELLCRDGTLHVPEIGAIAHARTVRGGLVAARYIHREHRVLELPPFSPGGRWAGQVFDLQLTMGGYTLWLGFEHGGRRRLDTTAMRGSRTACALAIDLEGAVASVDNADDAAAALEVAVREGPAPRRWLYHPNITASSHEARRRLHVRLATGGVGAYQARCLTCSSRWEGRGSPSQCPHCRERRPSQLDSW